MSEREFDKFLNLQRWHKDDYYTTADALGDARALFEAEHAKVSEPKLDTRAERAELQVSLLNALGSQLAEQAETLKTYKLSLEGIQCLLVDLDAKLASSRDFLSRINGREATNRERIDRIENAHWQPQLDSMHARVECIEKEHVKRHGGAELGTCRLVKRPHRRDCCGKAWQPLSAGPKKETENACQKPRKAGKRPAHKAGKRLKTSKL